VRALNPAILVERSPVVFVATEGGRSAKGVIATVLANNGDQLVGRLVKLADEKDRTDFAAAVSAKSTLPAADGESALLELLPKVDEALRKKNKKKAAEGHTVLVTADGEPLILDPGDPLPSAREFVDRYHVEAGVRALHHQASLFYAYDRSTSVYREHDEVAVRARVYGFLEKTLSWTSALGDQEPDLAPFKPTKSKVENVLDALRAVCNLHADSKPPCWLESDPGLAPFDILPCTNGLLYIPTRELLPATPAFFALNGIDYAYDPEAPSPDRWLQFLGELWPGDIESQEALRDWFGYQLTPDTRLQKMLMIVGPKRSGKGTIARVMRRVIGKRNVCGPTLANLGNQFGRETLIGKSAAIISDARISARTDKAAIVEGLLAISGEDALSIPRKYLPDWVGTLSTRFTLLTNELPRIEDMSGAFASRFIVLRLEQSFYGHEDFTLLNKLLKELPGIVKWALDGRDQLYKRGHFLQPASAAQLIQQLEDLGSPIGVFIRDRCKVGPGLTVSQQQLFNAWKAWCHDNGREHVGTIQTLGRNVHAAVPWVKVAYPHIGGVRIRLWEGLTLKDAST
jgi:putative DNA primase/helicase